MIDNLVPSVQSVLWNRKMKTKIKMRTMRKMCMSINIRLAFLKFMWFSPSFFLHTAVTVILAYAINAI